MGMVMKTPTNEEVRDVIARLMRERNSKDNAYAYSKEFADWCKEYRDWIMSRRNELLEIGKEIQKQMEAQGEFTQR